MTVYHKCVSNGGGGVNVYHKCVSRGVRGVKVYHKCVCVCVCVCVCMQWSEGSKDVSSVRVLDTEGGWKRCHKCVQWSKGAAVKTVDIGRSDRLLFLAFLLCFLIFLWGGDICSFGCLCLSLVWTTCWGSVLFQLCLLHVCCCCLPLHAVLDIPLGHDLPVLAPVPPQAVSCYCLHLHHVQDFMSLMAWWGASQHAVAWHNVAGCCRPM